MYSIAVVADDLTGVMDTTHEFAARGYETAVVAVPGTALVGVGDPQSTVFGINTDTRYDAAESADETIAEVVTTTRPDVVYKKVDSTLRGNLDTEIPAALDATGAAVAVVVPAYPALGRTTRDGVHFVNGSPLEATEYADDEKGQSVSTVADMFADTDRRVVHVGIDCVTAGRHAVIADIAREIDRSESPPIIVFDATKRVHLTTIADAALEFDTLYVGSAGLAEHVTIPSQPSEQPTPVSRTGRAPLGVIGSVNSKIFHQLAYVPNEMVLKMDPEAVLAGADTEIAERVIDELRAEWAVIITAAEDCDDVNRTIAAGRKQGLASAEIRTRVGTGLAATAATVVEQVMLSGFLYTGGDVAIACLRALETRVTTPTGTSIADGIPVSQLSDGCAAGTPMVTKAGGFGTPPTIVNCLEALVGNDE